MRKSTIAEILEKIGNIAHITFRMCLVLGMITIFQEDTILLSVSLITGLVFMLQPIFRDTFCKYFGHDMQQYSTGKMCNICYIPYPTEQDKILRGN